MKALTLNYTAVSLTLHSLLVSAAKVQCPGTFNPISAADFVKNINPGWNLGNTLDAVPDEGSWNNPRAQEKTFDDIKAAGFKGVRLPVTWTTKIGPGPTYTVSPQWLSRVSTVLDQITSRGLFAIVNVHHDSWQWFDFTGPGTSTTQIQAIEDKFYALWFQIATTLACKDSLVAFEPINEAKGNTKAQAEVLNKMNEVFLRAIGDAGGFNERRVVTLVGLGEDSVKTSQWFKKPSGSWSNPWAIQFHYYSPYDFIFTATGKTTWGSPSDKTALETDLRLIRQNFTNVPLIIGEWAASPVATESAARWKYFDFFTRTAAKYDIGTVLWDNGADFLDRGKGIWRDEIAKEIYMNAAKGIRNSLPESTVDGQATRQESSAYIFHKVGQAVGAQTLSFELNGNTVKGIRLEGGAALQTPSDYTVDGSSIKFSNSFLGRYIPPTAAPGIKASLTLQFSAGADSRIDIVQWDVPTMGGGASSRAVKGKDLSIPISWKGIPKIATVRAVLSDGKYLVDDWTKWLGPLQNARATYNNHWNWDSGHVILTKGAVDAVVQAGKSAIFTFEFWPRVPGNSLNYTLTL